MAIYDATGAPIVIGPTPKWEAFREHATQQALWRAITSPLGAGGSRFVVCEAPRRSGKTALFKRGGVREAFSNVKYDDHLVVFAAPTRDQAKQIYWDDICALTPRRLVRYRSESKLFEKLANGSTIQVVGMDKPQRIEGRPVDWIGCDEFAEWRQESYDKHVRPTLSTPGRPGRAMFYGVPRPSKMFRDLAARAREPSNANEWAYFWWDHSGILDPEEVESARRTMAPRLWEQEYRGLRVSYSGRVYYTYDRAKHSQDATTHQPGLPLVICFDFNVDPGVAVVLQVQQYRGPRTDVGPVISAVLGEVWIPDDSRTEMVCRKLIADWSTRHSGEVRCYGDRNGGSRHTSQSKVEGGDWKQIRDLLSSVPSWRVTVRVKNANPPERERVNVVCGRLAAADGTVRALIPERQAPRLCDDLEMVTVKPGTDGEIDKNRDKSLTHPTDAWGYFEEYEHGGGGASSLTQF